MIVTWQLIFEKIMSFPLNKNVLKAVKKVSKTLNRHPKFKYEVK